MKVLVLFDAWHQHNVKQMSYIMDMACKDIDWGLLFCMISWASYNAYILVKSSTTNETLATNEMFDKLVPLRKGIIK